MSARYSSVQTDGDGEFDRPPILEAVGVSKTYGHVTALDDVSMKLFPGEIVGLVGDNGAGKSTLVSILSGVNQPDQGSILINGSEVRIDSAQTALDLGIATVFQDLALVEQRNVAANLHLGREPSRYRFFVNRRRMLHESRIVIQQLGVNLPSVRAPVRDLSGGQRQSVAVARAVLRGGKVMLMDEPTAALGIREAGQVATLMRRLRHEGHAVLLISHNLISVFELADRIIVLRLGRVVAERQVNETSRDEIVGLIVGARRGDNL